MQVSESKEDAKPGEAENSVVQVKGAEYWCGTVLVVDRIDLWRQPGY